MPDQVHREIELPMPVERAWAAISSPSGLEDWLADEVHIDPVPGGEAEFRDGASVRTGWVEEVRPPEIGREAEARLAFWWSEPDGTASRVELALTPLPGERTRLRVSETRPLELLDLVGLPLPGTSGRTFGPALVAA